MNKEVLAKLAEKENDTEFVAAVTNAQTVEEVRTVLAGYGIEVSEDEIAEIMNHAEGEISEDQLDDVAGGLKKKYKCNECGKESWNSVGAWFHLIFGGHWSSPNE